jgi:2-amino-4-hydroxy-6-hydroxymethyldihydropteridine diphosphokinase
MKPVICYLGIGSNLEQPREQIARALQTLAAHPDITPLKQSPWYTSKAIGPGNRQDNTQPDYVNGVIEIETSLAPQNLLLALQQIESAQGRTRKVRWGARTLDLDILLYGDQKIHCHNLTIPHPRIRERNFVLVPLADLNPYLPLSMLYPDNPNVAKNETITSLLATLSREGLRLLDEHSTHEQSFHE